MIGTAAIDSHKTVKAWLTDRPRESLAIELAVMGAAP